MAGLIFAGQSNDSVKVNFCDISNFAFLYLLIYLFILYCITFVLHVVYRKLISLQYVSVSYAQRRCKLTNRHDVGLCHNLSQNRLSIVLVSLSGIKTY